MLRAFESGADGVMVVGCLEGDCHFVKGNLRAKERVKRTDALLQSAGIGAERVRMYNLSAGEGAKFAAHVSDMTSHIADLGPSIINQKRQDLSPKETSEKEGQP